MIPHYHLLTEGAKKCEDLEIKNNIALELKEVPMKAPDLNASLQVEALSSESSQEEKDAFLFKAVQTNDLSKVKEAMEKGANPMALQPSFVRRISQEEGDALAALPEEENRARKLKGMELLSRASGWFLLTNVYRNSFFLAAAFQENIEILKYFLEKGVDINIAVECEVPCLTEIEHVADLDELSQRTLEGEVKGQFYQRALEAAIKGEYYGRTNFEAIQFLVKQGADLSYRSSKNVRNESYLDMAFRFRRDLQVILFLLENGIEFNTTNCALSGEFPFAKHFFELNERIKLVVDSFAQPGPDFNPQKEMDFLQSALKLLKYLICARLDKKIEQTLGAYLEARPNENWTWPTQIPNDVMERAKGTSCEGVLKEIDDLYRQRPRKRLLSQEIGYHFGTDTVPQRQSLENVSVSPSGLDVDPVPSLAAQCLQKVVNTVLDSKPLLWSKASKQLQLSDLPEEVREKFPREIQEKVFRLMKYEWRCRI